MGAEAVAAAVGFVTLLATTGGGLLYVGFRVGGVLASIEAFRAELLKCQGSSRLVHEVVDRRLERHDITLANHGERLIKVESQLEEV